MDEIMKKYANDVKRFCMSLCHDSALADELTQETFYRALKTIHHYNGDCSMTSWLFLIAKRCWIDMMKKRKFVVSYDEVENEMGTDESPESLFRRKLQRQYLNELLDELKEPEHSVFIMRALLDKSFKDIGREFGKSENWARVMYYRIRMRLAERVRKDEAAL